MNRRGPRPKPTSPKADTERARVEYQSTVRAIRRFYYDQGNSLYKTQRRFKQLDPDLVRDVVFYRVERSNG